MNNEANKIVKKLETQAFSNKTFDILNYMEVVSTNIICSKYKLLNIPWFVVLWKTYIDSFYIKGTN